MPIYEYECPECGERFSRLRPMREMDAPTPCPRCQKAEARRVVSQFAATGMGSCTPAG